MSKKVQAIVKMQVKAGMANPSPPIGPSLGQQGVNIGLFCKEFNSKTSQLEPGIPVPVIVTIYSDRSFTFVIKSSPASILLKKAAGIEKGSSNPNKKIVGKVNNLQILQIAQEKKVDMTGKNIDSIIKSIAGTAKSMGILIQD